MMITVLRKSTVRPWPSVSRPSSSTCSSTLNTSGCAFSTSSSSTTRRAGGAPPRSGSRPPRSRHSPGGAPIRRATECFSMNSDMSMRTMASSVSNRNSASALHSSVLPTPVGPRNRNEPLGRRGSDSPARERRIAFETMRTASSWPTTRLLERLFHAQQLFLLALEHLARPECRSTWRPLRRSPPRSRCCAPAAVSRLLGALRLLQPLFELGHLAVLQLGHARQIAGAPRLSRAPGARARAPP